MWMRQKPSFVVDHVTINFIQTSFEFFSYLITAREPQKHHSMSSLQFKYNTLNFHYERFFYNFEKQNSF